jgi:hypothetical protein
MLRIKSYCHIKQNRIYLDGKLLFEDQEAETLKAFAVKAFRNNKFNYPKFFKMDEISKLGFLASEVLLSNLDEPITNENVGIVLSNASSTLVTDTTFQDSIKSSDNFFPSPSVFVYTLPNIMIGEISIRNKFKGENAFFIFDHFNETFLTDYIDLLHLTGKVNNCLGGWVDQSKDNYEAFMYIAISDKPVESIVEHKAEEVRKLYEFI